MDKGTEIRGIALCCKAHWSWRLSRRLNNDAGRTVGGELEGGYGLY